ncbi:MAG: hypothetical protein IPK84_01065 [Candidatus Moraniibacteriota bacterium]|nr:MAG: hypothetical protein IPK84_01065 [Candidatus Moranbacteria bacterium]
MSTLKKSGIAVVVSMVLLLGVGLVWKMTSSGCKWAIGSGSVSVSCKERYPDIVIQDIQILSDNNNSVLQQGERMYIMYISARAVGYVAWSNQKTGQTEWFEADAFPPAERMKEFLPQNPAAQGLYDVYIDQGKTPEESAILVLESSLDIRHKE